MREKDDQSPQAKFSRAAKRYERLGAERPESDAADRQHAVELMAENAGEKTGVISAMVSAASVHDVRNLTFQVGGSQGGRARAATFQERNTALQVEADKIWAKNSSLSKNRVAGILVGRLVDIAMEHEVDTSDLKQDNIRKIIRRE